MHTNTATTTGGDPIYVLGHSARELQRLRLQSGYWAEPTLRTLKEAGLRRGMRVLDLGCGGGDVSLLAAGIVGPEGSVVGIDRSPEAVGRAATRVHDEELTNVSFHVGDVDGTLDVAGPFDAIIGRFVLMYLPAPVATLRRLRPLLADDGVVAFIEMDVEASRSVPAVPLVTTALNWLTETLRRGGAQSAMGPQVWHVLGDAGFVETSNRVWWEAVCPPAVDLSRLLAETVRSLLPMMGKLGIADAENVRIDTLAERLQAEVTQARATLLPPTIVGTWARMPASSASN
jgi:ubiquinone/menaquinone biosynthesis C-methylase UbiE